MIPVENVNTQTYGYELQRLLLNHDNEVTEDLVDFVSQFEKIKNPNEPILFSSYSAHTYNVLYYFSALYYRIYGDYPTITSLLGAYLHDFGKFFQKEIFFSDQIIPKEKIHLIEHHVHDGYDFLKKRFPQYDEIHKMALYHHERSDASGYPSKKLQLPPSVSLLATVDVFVAIHEPRKYRKNKINTSMEWDKEKPRLFDPFRDEVASLMKK